MITHPQDLPAQLGLQFPPLNAGQQDSPRH